MVIEISAVTGQGLEFLKKTIERMIFGSRIRVNLIIPYTEGAVLAWIHSKTKVLRKSFTEQGTVMEVDMEKSLLEKVSKYRVYSGYPDL